jgi:hypothetical protein
VFEKPGPLSKVELLGNSGTKILIGNFEGFNKGSFFGIIGKLGLFLVET